MVEKNNFATILRHNYIYIDDINFTNITKFQFYTTDDYRTLLYHLNTLVVMFGEHDFFKCQPIYLITSFSSPTSVNEPLGPSKHKTFLPVFPIQCLLSPI